MKGKLHWPVFLWYFVLGVPINIWLGSKILNDFVKEQLGESNILSPQAIGTILGIAGTVLCIVLFVLYLRSSNRSHWGWFVAGFGIPICVWIIFELAVIVWVVALILIAFLAFGFASQKDDWLGL